MSYQAKIFLLNLIPKERTPCKISHIGHCGFSIIYLTETFCNCINISHFDTNIYKAIPFERKTNKEVGSILTYVKTDLMYQIRKDLSISDKDKKKLTIEIISKESKKLVAFLLL